MPVSSTQPFVDSWNLPPRPTFSIWQNFDHIKRPDFFHINIIRPLWYLVLLNSYETVIYEQLAFWKKNIWVVVSSFCKNDHVTLSEHVFMSKLLNRDVFRDTKYVPNVFLPFCFLFVWLFLFINHITRPKSNKTVSDGGITVDFSIIKVHTSNWSSNSWGSSNTWGSLNSSC